MGLPENDTLRLTDFMDLPTLQEIQDSFAAIANVKATITDADGNLLTQPNPTAEFLHRQRAIAQAEEAEASAPGPSREGREYVAPITINNQRLGTIRMKPGAAPIGIDDARLVQLSEKFGIDLKQLKSLAGYLSKTRQARPAAIQFLYLLANAIARLCFQEFQLRQRINELTAVYNVTMMLSEARDLQKVLQRTVEVVGDVMETKAASIRLLDPDRDEMIIKAVHNLSPEYLGKGRVGFSSSLIDKEALSPKGFAYVRNMTEDPRVLYPQESGREGIVSMLSVGMRYKGRPIGVLRVYTGVETHFSQLKIDMLKAVASQAAAAIENARLLEESIEAEKLERQVQLAAEVQQRMIPDNPPPSPGVDISSEYVPCYSLGGDFYDFIAFPDSNVGLVMADVSGKGVPASLIMASVRAALRAQADNVYYLYEVMRRLNVMLCRDTKSSEFVTLFYGVLDSNIKRLTYCSAGHPPALLLRDGKVSELASENMVLGISPDEVYTQEFIDLLPGDLLMLYTDGLPDAMNYQQETFGRARVIEAFKQGGETAEAVVQNVLWHMRRFVGFARATDDVTMTVLRVI